MPLQDRDVFFVRLKERVNLKAAKHVANITPLSTSPYVPKHTVFGEFMEGYNTLGNANHGYSARFKPSWTTVCGVGFSVRGHGETAFKEDDGCSVLYQLDRLH